MWAAVLPLPRQVYPGSGQQVGYPGGGGTPPQAGQPPPASKPGPYPPQPTQREAPYPKRHPDFMKPQEPYPPPPHMGAAAGSPYPPPQQQPQPQQVPPPATQQYPDRSQYPYRPPHMMTPPPSSMPQQGKEDATWCRAVRGDTCAWATVELFDVGSCKTPPQETARTWTPPALDRVYCGAIATVACTIPKTN